MYYEYTKYDFKLGYIISELKVTLIDMWPKKKSDKGNTRKFTED
jgi:hypothetical protein